MSRVRIPGGRIRIRFENKIDVGQMVEGVKGAQESADTGNNGAVFADDSARIYGSHRHVNGSGTGLNNQLIGLG